VEQLLYASTLSTFNDRTDRGGASRNPVFPVSELPEILDADAEVNTHCVNGTINNK
jgi:hypothetical protein